MVRTKEGIVVQRAGTVEVAVDGMALLCWLYRASLLFLCSGASSSRQGLAHTETVERVERVGG